MTGDGFARVRELFHLASELPQDERDAFLASSESDDRVLAEVRDLLAHHTEPDPLLRTPALGVAIADDVQAPLPERIGRYRVLRLIGEGGMGTVYEAEQDVPRRRVALKVIRPALLGSRAQARFQMEIEALGRLRHRDIAQIFDAGSVEIAGRPVPYFAMEFVEGESLRAFVREQRPPRRDLLRLFTRICDAVAYAHQRGIIHRDLKPANILVERTSGARPKILDFGVARTADAEGHTVTGQLVGTPAYMSPEQLTGGGVDTRTDVYSLGVILYEMLAGVAPYESTDLPSTIRAVESGSARPLAELDRACRGDLTVITGKAMERDPDARYRSASELADDVRRHLASKPIHALPPTIATQFRKFARRNKALFAASASGLLALAAGLAIAIVFAVGEFNQRMLVSERERDARWDSYRYVLSAAGAALELGDPLQAAALLDEAPEEFRNWEWWHLSRRAHPEATDLVFEGAIRERYMGTSALTPEGRGLAVFLDGEGAHVVDVESGKAEARFGGRWIGAALHERGGRVGLFRADGCEIRDVASLGLIAECSAFMGPEVVATFSPSGGRLAVGVDETGEALLIDGTDGTIVWSGLADDSREFSALAFSPGGDRLVIGRIDREFRHGVWLEMIDTATGEVLAERVLLQGMHGLSFSPDGETIGMGSQEQVLFLRADDLSTERVLEPFPATVAALTFGPNGGSVAVSDNSPAVSVWDVDGGTRRSVTAFTHGTVAYDGRSVLTANAWGASLVRWTDPNPATLDTSAAYVYDLALSADGRMIVTGGFAPELQVWSADDGSLLGTLPVPGKSRREPVRALSFSPDGSRVVARAAGKTFVWELGRDAPPEKIGEDSSAFLVRCAADVTFTMGFFGHSRVADRESAIVYDAAESGAIVLRDAASGETVREVAVTLERPVSIAVRPDRSVAAIGGMSGDIALIDLADGEEIGRLVGHRQWVYSLAFSPDGSRLASGGEDRTVRLWDLERLDQVARLAGHANYVHVVRFSPDGTSLISGSGDGTARIYRAQAADGAASR